jgi:hypothetical protein
MATVETTTVTCDVCGDSVSYKTHLPKKLMEDWVRCVLALHPFDICPRCWSKMCLAVDWE